MNPLRWTADRLASLAGYERREVDVDAKLLQEQLGYSPNYSGIPVTPKGALSLTAAFACINVLSTDLAALPLKPYQRLPNGGRREAREHPLWESLSTSPDGETTSMRMRQSMFGHVFGWGNGYAEIGFRRDGKAARLYLLEPTQVQVDRTPITKALFYQVDGRSFPPRRIFHMAGLGFDGLRGYAPVTLCRQAIGLGLAQETTAAGIFGNGAQPGGVIETTIPFLRDKDQRAQFRSDWEAAHRGAHNAGKVAVLEPGMKFHATTIPPEDAQFLQSRQFQVLEIARLYRVPPNKVGDWSQSHLANVEAANLDYLATVIVPWCIQYEQWANFRLLTPEERADGFYIEHLVTALLRGDMKARSEFYREALANGWMSRDEVRERENLNPIGPDRGGDLYTIQSAMTTLEIIASGGLQNGGTNVDN